MVTREWNLIKSAQKVNSEENFPLLLSGFELASLSHELGAPSTELFQLLIRENMETGLGKMKLNAPKRKQSDGRVLFL